MITGFNTDVEHGGVVYHVQTEDKGLKSPLILSLVYVGGTILASKRTPYNDMISEGFDEKKLAERLNRQHKLICAAIHAGRIEDLKRQTERESATRAKPVETEAQPAAPLDQTSETPVMAHDELEIIQGESFADFMPPSAYTPPAAPTPPAPDTIDIPPEPHFEHVDYSRVVDYESVAAVQADGLQISLMDEKRFVAGEFVKINVHVGSGEDGLESVAEATVTLKVLGSSFRPLIFSGKTGSDGIASFYAMLPYFTSGRAAILINATAGGDKAELRRVIHQA